MTRSNMTKNCEPAMNGVAMTTRSDVVKFAHTRRGIRQKVIPGARIVMIVTRKFSAVAIDDAPANCTPKLKKDCPNGAPVDSGEDRDDEDEDHQCRVRREEAVEEAGVDDLRARLGELGAHQHRDQAAA